MPKRLLEASKRGDTNAVKSLVQGGIDPRVKDNNGWTPFHWAIQTKNLELARFLLKYDKTWFLDERTGQGWFNGQETPLILAAKQKNKDLVFGLLRRGALIDAIDQNGKTAFEFIQENLDKASVINAVLLSDTRKKALKNGSKYFQQGQNAFKEGKLEKSKAYLNLSIKYFEELLELDEDSKEAIKFSKVIDLILKEIRVRENAPQKAILSTLQSVEASIADVRDKAGSSHQEILSRIKPMEASIADVRDKAGSSHQEILSRIEPMEASIADVRDKAKLQLIDADHDYERGVRKYRHNRESGLILFEKAKEKYKKAFLLNRELENFSEGYQHVEKILSIPVKEEIDQKFLKEELNTHYACAVLSQNVYPAYADKAPKFSDKSSCRFVRIIEPESQKTSRHKAGYVGKVYEINVNGKNCIVISHCGTVHSENGDLAADALLVFDSLHVQFSLAKKLTEEIIIEEQVERRKLKVYHTGHSLGAVLAEVSASEYGHDAITFESPGSYDLLSKTKGHTNSKIITYLVAPNFVNTLKPHIGICYRLHIEGLKVSVNPDVDKIATGLFKWITSVLGVQEAIDKLDQIKEPLIKIFSRDVRLHKIDNIVDEFTRAVEYDNRELDRREIIKWPIGPFQYFSLATLMIEENQFEPDELIENLSFKYLSSKKSIYYEVVRNLEICLMSELPQSGKPEKGKIYLEKQKDKLEYIMLSPKQEKIVGKIDIFMPENLTKELLNKKRSEILRLISKIDDVHIKKHVVDSSSKPRAKL